MLKGIDNSNLGYLFEKLKSIFLTKSAMVTRIKVYGDPSTTVLNNDTVPSSLAVYNRVNLIDDMQYYSNIESSTLVNGISLWIVTGRTAVYPNPIVSANFQISIDLGYEGRAVFCTASSSTIVFTPYKGGKIIWDEEPTIEPNTLYEVSMRCITTDSSGEKIYAGICKSWKKTW